MRSWMFVLLVFFVCYKHAFAKCPSGEYHPGDDCSFEVICGVPSAHSAREHYCDCWCKPPLIRDTITKTCVEECPRYSLYAD